jgi:hypothetical protein
MQPQPTHTLTVTSRSGQRVNPVTFGSPAFRTAYGLVDLAVRLALVASDPDLEVTVEPTGAEVTL